jgi:nucleotide-binding universal stress UspA family protein
MTIKTVAVGLMNAAEAEWLIPAACSIAAMSGAHLIGVHPVEPFVPYVGGDMSASVAMMPMFLDWQIEETAAIKAVFDHNTTLQDFVGDWRAQDVGTFGSGEFLVDNLRGADLVLLGQAKPSAALREQARLQEQAIRQSGRPVLVLPRGWTPSGPATRLLIGWSNTREAARAAHDALDLVAPGAAVDIVSIGDAGSGSDAATLAREDLAAALHRRGFKANIIIRAKGTEDVPDILLQVALEQGAELIAVGAFGHSRAYDVLVGAVTRDLIARSGLPLLLAN